MSDATMPTTIRSDEVRRIAWMLSTAPDLSGARFRFLYSQRFSGADSAAPQGGGTGSARTAV